MASPSSKKPDTTTAPESATIDSLERAKGKITWQQTKSQLTRASILQATVDCFYELGFTKTTTEQVAKRANVSRGAMLHHFPSRMDLVKETIKYLNQQRIEMFAREEFAVQQDSEYTDVGAGINTYWRQLNTPTFIVFHELKIASRTDPELGAVVEPALREFESAWHEAVKDLFPDLARSAAFERANYVTRFLLEGMAVARSVDSDAANVPEQDILEWLKRDLRESFKDVLGKVKRPKNN